MNSALVVEMIEKLNLGSYIQSNNEVMVRAEGVYLSSGSRCYDLIEKSEVGEQYLNDFYESLEKSDKLCDVTVSSGVYDFDLRVAVIKVENVVEILIKKVFTDETGEPSEK